MSYLSFGNIRQSIATARSGNATELIPFPVPARIGYDPSAENVNAHTVPRSQPNRRAMTITLNHTIVPARDKVAAAKFFAKIFGLKRGRTNYFAPVRVNKALTLLFDDDTKFESHHLAFHVSKAEFEAILARVKKAGLSYGSAPWSLDDGKLNDWGGGRGVYFQDPNGHVLELMTVAQ